MKNIHRSRLPKKLSALATVVIAGAAIGLVAASSAAAQTVTDTWSSPAGAWTGARDALAGASPAINGGTWADPVNWTNAGLTPHAFAFTADAGSTGGAALGVSDQTKYPFSSAATYFNTAANVSPAFNLVDGTALAGVGTISLTIIGGNNTAFGVSPYVGDGPILSFNGGVSDLAPTSQDAGLSSVVLFGSTYYGYTTYTWDVGALDVTAFSIDWTHTATASFIHTISLSQSVAGAAVPEPAAFAGLSGAAALGGALLRRRRRS